ncbi:hypothetical protein EA770_07245 [Acinetobacter baumannii]|nr:hypothetical protein EA770_07245 [Acinetobacter baumannii]
MKIYLISILMIISTGTYAGVTITGTGETPELACWNHDYNANERARDRTTCYTSCKLDKVTYDGNLYKFSSGVPNHQGSCKKAKYDRGAKGRDWFLSNYPKPGSKIEVKKEKNNSDISNEIRNGVNSAVLQTNGNNAALVVTNPTNYRGRTYYKVYVRDTGYSFPQRVLESGEVIVDPKTTWVKHFHQWRAADWNLEYQ